MLQYNNPHILFFLKDIVSRILKNSIFQEPIAKVFRPMDEVTIDKKTQIKRKLFAKLGLKVPYVSHLYLLSNYILQYSICTIF